MTLDKTAKVATGTQIHEIVNYFGKCRDCGYPATAAVHVTAFTDGTVSSMVVATCGMPCGWTAAVPPTTMGGDPVIHNGFRSH